MDLKIVIGLMLLLVKVIHTSTRCKTGFYSNGTTCVHCSHEPVPSSDAFVGYRIWCSGVCSKGGYGLQCSEKCSKLCKNRWCQRWTGRCVYGCSDGWYGDTCNKRCSRGCKIGLCSRGGNCVGGCKTGYYGPSCIKCPEDCADCRSRYGCQKCKPGYYGKYCDSMCSNCNGLMCDFITGKCKLGCVTSWYGGRCSQKCPSNCKTIDCNSTDGVCDGCKPGYRGHHCNLTCPKFCENCHQDEETCDVCKQGRYGHLCASSCNGCHNDLCDVKGICTLVCTANYYGPKCDRVRKCNPGCAQNTCDLTTGACTEGCSNSSYGTYCNLTCSHKCKERHCEEDNSGIVKCTRGCVDDWWGFHCEHQCSENCEKCQNETGKCENCTNHTYGHNCSQTCSDGCMGQDCDMTGICRQGCVDGWWGSHCEHQCSEDCEKCQNEMGKCENCTNHTYGHNCSKTCSDGCVGQDCHMTGICRQGCLTWWIGERCQVFTLWYLLSGCAAAVLLTVCVTHWLCSRRRTKCCLQSRLYLNPVESSTSGDPGRQDHIARRNSSAYTEPTYHLYHSIRDVDVIEMEEIEPDENRCYDTL